jgi:predicted ArsR family transcriptional regulator
MGLPRTRQEIVRLLRCHGDMTVRELAAALGLTPMSIRLHLNRLQREGLVTARLERQPVGRPHHRYRLTAAADALFPTNYCALADSLLTALRQQGGPDQVARLCQEALTALAAPYLVQTDRPLTERVQALVRCLQHLGFLLEVQETPADLRLRALNCPFTVVAEHHPELCQAEQALVTQALGAEIDGLTVERPEHRLHGDPCCTYRIRGPAPVPAPA